MARLPDSRKKLDGLVQLSKEFVDHSITGLKTSAQLETVGKSNTFREVVFPSVSTRSRTIKSCTAEPVVSHKRMGQWLSRSGDCLHCGTTLTAASDSEANCVPLVKYKLDGLFWVFGQFCSPNCALGYAQEHCMGPQIQTFTRSMLISVFGCKEPFDVAPPRFMLKKYGGPMDEKAWKRTSFYVIKDPPLCTFAMYAECKSEATVTTNSDILLRGLRRPETREAEPAKPSVTGREPVVLRILAEEQQPSPKRIAKPQAIANKKSKASGLSMFMDEE